MNPQSSTRPPRPAIRLHIERLIVDEALLAGGGAAALQAAVETELTRLLGERGLSPLGEAAVPSLSARNIQVAARPRANQLGGQIGQAVYAALHPANPAPAAATRSPRRSS